MTEELVQRLVARFAEVVAPIDGIAGLSDYEHACDIARAEECIRQMEWMRAQCLEWVGGHYAHENIRDFEATLAPPDWKPKED